MTTQKGSIQVNTENIFPIIKKFLYSDHEIFLRELISNATDATTKLKHFSSIGEFKGELGDLRIEVKIDSKKKTLSIIDRGVGMTAEEIEKLIRIKLLKGNDPVVAVAAAVDDEMHYNDNDNDNDNVTPMSAS